MNTDFPFAGLPEFFLSPMEGVFTPWFVRACSELKLVSFWMTPFISVTGGSIPSPAAIRKRLKVWQDTGLPYAVQLLGKDSESLIRCAENVFQAFGERPVNLNFACPSPTVNRHGAGAAMLGPGVPFAGASREFKKHFPEIPVSLKLRAGVHAPDVREIVRAAVDSGADALVFHGRTRDEMYETVPELPERIALAVEYAGKVPVIGNGNIFSAADALKMKRDTGCAGVAAARGFLKNPALIRSMETGTELYVSPQVLTERMFEDHAPEALIREIFRHAGTPFSVKKEPRMNTNEHE